MSMEAIGHDEKLLPAITSAIACNTWMGPACTAVAVLKAIERQGYLIVERESGRSASGGDGGGPEALGLDKHQNS
jgi:hypothetical protein